MSGHLARHGRCGRLSMVVEEFGMGTRSLYEAEYLVNQVSSAFIRFMTPRSSALRD